MSDSTAYWDAAIVGAGVAGGAAAGLLAERGWRVLLIEKSAWPRNKVCGGCLSASAVAALSGIGIDSTLHQADPIDSVVWQVGASTLEVPVPRGVAILRSDLDSAIVSAAMARGCEFYSGCSATLLPPSAGEPFRKLKLQTADQTSEIRAGVVIAADGLGGTLLAAEPWAKWTISPKAWMGVAATYESKSGESQSSQTPAGCIHMHIGNNGYVGMVRIDGIRDHLAAALDPASCRLAGGPANLVREILSSCRKQIPTAMQPAKFKGTGALTRRREQLGGYRVLVVGDACGYVEPFTGEGMAWAAIGAREMVDLLPAPSAWPDDLPARWRHRYLQIIGRQQRWCRGMRATMHHPAMAAAGILIGSAMPMLANWIAQAICRPPKKEIRDDQSGRFRFPGNQYRINPGDLGHRHRESDIGAAEVRA